MRDYLAAVTQLAGDQCLEALVLRYGQEFEAPTSQDENRKRMEAYGVRPGRRGACFENAAGSALNGTGLIYVEGFAAGIIQTQHAWLATLDKEVIEPTWVDRPGSTYFGIPFATDWLRRWILETEVWGVFQFTSASRHLHVQGLPEEALWTPSGERLG